MDSKWWMLGFFGLLVALASIFGSLSAIDASEAYAQLEQPSWAPPGWLFGPVWTALYIGMAVAGWLAWLKVDTLNHVSIRLFFGQLFMNAMWTPFFFSWGLRGFALAWIVALDVLVFATIWQFWRLDRRAAGLLIPYQAWILFATALNAAVWLLNR